MNNLTGLYIVSTDLLLFQKFQEHYTFINYLFNLFSSFFPSIFYIFKSEKNDISTMHFVYVEF